MQALARVMGFSELKPYSGSYAWGIERGAGRIDHGFDSAEDLKRLRKFAQMSQTMLGQAAGFHRITVSRWENAPGRIDGSAPHAFRAVLSPFSDQYARAREAEPPKTCGARTRTGTPCLCKPVKGKRRCRLHGGLSTGPRRL